MRVRVLAGELLCKDMSFQLREESICVHIYRQHLPLVGEVKRTQSGALSASTYTHPVRSSFVIHGTCAQMVVRRRSSIKPVSAAAAQR